MTDRDVIDIKVSGAEERPRIDPDLFDQIFERPSKITQGGAPGKLIEAPGKIPGDAPGKIPGDAPGKIPGDAPGKIPGDAPGKIPGDAPGKIPGDAPGKIPGDAPGKIPGDAPGKIPGDAPGKIPGDAPGKIPGDAPGKIPGDAPGKIPGDAPGKIPGDAPGKIPGDAPGEAPGKIPGDGPAEAPGKNQGGSIIENLDRLAMIREAGDAARNGSAEGLTNAILNAFENCNGDGKKFQKFGQSFAEQAAKDGITVKAGKDSIAIHKDGSPYGVEFKVDGNLDFKTGQVKGEAKAQAYDWSTKKDVKVNPADVIRDLNRKRR